MTQEDWYDDPEVRERFFEKVDRNASGGEPGCWLWKAAVGSHGYGAFGVTHDDVLLAHRVAYALERGESPERGVLRHTCDTPRCVNPDHLIHGSQSENLSDAVERGGYGVGEDHQNAELTETDIREIRERYSSGNETQAEIADDFDIARPTVSDIVRGRRWSHVE